VTDLEEKTSESHNFLPVFVCRRKLPFSLILFYTKEPSGHFHGICSYANHFVGKKKSIHQCFFDRFTDIWRARCFLSFFNIGRVHPFGVGQCERTEHAKCFANPIFKAVSIFSPRKTIKAIL